MSKPYFGSLALAVCLALSVSPAHAGSVKVREGTEVRLQLAQQLTSASAVAGQKFNLTLEEDLRVDGVLVAPRGTQAIGSVVSARHKGMMGKAGELDVKVDYLLVGDQHLRLRASNSQTGTGKVGATVALTVLFGPIGLIKKGKDVVMPQGMSMVASVDESTDLAVADAMIAPTALEAPVPAPIDATAPAAPAAGGAEAPASDAVAAPAAPAASP